MSMITLDKIGSVLSRARVPVQVELAPEVEAAEGAAVVVEALEARSRYGELELASGRTAAIKPGDVIAGALGERRALVGIVGDVPDAVRPGDTLSILNLGGVIGRALSWNQEVVSSPISVRVLGAPIVRGRPLNIHSYAPRSAPRLRVQCPVIAVMGTCMHVGKTTVACELIHLLARRRGLAVAAAKLTGVAAQRDILAMRDAGAARVLTFHDLGLVSTINNHNAVLPAARTILNLLGRGKPDVMVIELGDGVVGWYGVDRLLADSEFVRTVSFTVLCARDLAGAVGAAEIIGRAGGKVDLFSGPVTNNTSGTDFLEQKLGVPAQDLRSGTDKFEREFDRKVVSRG